MNSIDVTGCLDCPFCIVDFDPDIGVNDTIYFCGLYKHNHSVFKYIKIFDSSNPPKNNKNAIMVRTTYTNH